MTNDLIASMVLVIWLYLLAGRGMFWLARERDDEIPAARGLGRRLPPLSRRATRPNAWARPWLRCCGRIMRGEFAVILVDDQSRDATAQVARDAAAALGAAERLTVLAGRALPSGWTGKLWAQHQGVEAAESCGAAAGVPAAHGCRHRLRHRMRSSPWSPGRNRAATCLTSLMAKLRCESLAERVFIPAFIFFFQMLYPFAWANDPRRATAAAAGGCMLVRGDALARSGGMAAIRSALIDDCALAKALKAHGPIWLGLTERVCSIRAYPALGDIRRMVSRSAYAQLRYSPLLLVGTVVGLAVTYLAPVVLAVFAGGMARLLGMSAWLLMALAFQPTLRFYRLSPLWGVALPAIAAGYMAFTVDSAYQHARGRGGMWKGRAQANVQGNVSELR